MNRTQSGSAQTSGLKQKALTGLAIIAVLAIVLYSAGWFWYAGKIRDEADHFLKTAGTGQIRISGAPTSVEGFPGRPVLTWSGVVEYAGIAWQIPFAAIRSWFVAGHDMQIVMPQGLTVHPFLYTMPEWNFDYAHIQMPIPAALPDRMTDDALRRWKRQNGTIKISDLTARLDEFTLSGQARLSVDSHLQPRIDLSAQSTGYHIILDRLKGGKIIDASRAMFIQAALDTLADPDPETGQKKLAASLRVENQQVMIGPLKLGKIPYILWPEDMLIDSGQAPDR